MKNIYLLVGASGSGKTTLAERMADKYHLKTVESYTTRPMRYANESGHIFVTDEEFDALGPMIAFTNYGGYRYGVTQEVVDTHDIYVIDPFGVEFMQSKYTGDKGIVVIWLDVPEKIRRARMEQRGDTEENIVERLLRDRKIFDAGAWDFVPDMILPNCKNHLASLDAEADMLYHYIWYLENYGE